MRRSALLLPLTAILFAGCATVPLVPAWRPWLRTSEEPAGALPASGSFVVTVQGETEPLAGDETLFQGELRVACERVLTRRGFTRVDAQADLIVALSYRSTGRDRNPGAFTFMSPFFQGRAPLNRVMGETDGSLGVGIASTLNADRLQRQSLYASGPRREPGFEHAIGLEIRDSQGRSLWKGDALWESSEPDIAMGFEAALRILACTMPTDPAHAVPVPRSEPARVDDFVRTQCAGGLFLCPALPYPVAFSGFKGGSSKLASYGELQRMRGRKSDRATGEEDRTAVAVYVDLLQNAEIALPNGGDGGDDPLDRGMWGQAILGGRYRIGDATAPVPVLVELTGDESGYVVDRAYIATEVEFGAFQRRLADWKTRLRASYGMNAKE